VEKIVRSGVRLGWPPPPERQHSELYGGKKTGGAEAFGNFRVLARSFGLCLVPIWSE
jgi:hypothetical protein